MAPSMLTCHFLSLALGTSWVWIHASADFICPEYCNCTGDKEFFLVNCSSRNFQHVPHGLPNSTTTLLLSNNAIGDIANFTFMSLTELKFLNLSCNNISYLEKDVFWGLNNLITLDLSKNCLFLCPVTYPFDVFAPLSSLKNLYLQNNSKVLSDLVDLLQCNRLSNDIRFVKNLSSSHSRPSTQYSRKRFLNVFAQDQQNSFTGNPNDSLKFDGTFTRMTDIENSLNSSSTQKDKKGETRAINRHGTYPDEALSQLLNLQILHIDGLPNSTFGTGFRQLVNLSHLILSRNSVFCSLCFIINETFANLPQVQYLDLTDCNIEYITSDAFGALRNLKTLNLSYNRNLGFQTLGEALYGLTKTKIKELILNSIVPMWSPGIVIRKNQMRHLKNLTNLRVIVAGYNRIEMFEPGVLCGCLPPSLTDVYLYGNPLSMACYISEFYCIQSLKVLNINGYNNSEARPFKFPNMTAMCDYSFPESPGFHSNGETCKEQGSINEYYLPPNLKELHMEYFGVFYILGHIPINKTNSLEIIRAKGNIFPAWKGPVEGLEKLKQLDLRDAKCEFLEKHFFDSFSDLEMLDIGGNPLHTVLENDREGELFRELKSLKTLRLSRNLIRHLPESIFSSLYHLEELDLSINSIEEFTTIITHMSNISLLNISNNLLDTLPSSLRQHLDALAEVGNVTVDIMFNPIACTCQNLDFLRWLRDSKVNFGTLLPDSKVLLGKSNYICNSLNGKKQMIEDIRRTITELEKECMNDVGVFAGASLVCVIVVMILAVTLTYRYRWKLRYLYYASRLNFLNTAPSDRFEVDAFVSFSSEDSNFVMGELRSQLEDGYGLKLCIHTCDFLPGRYIAANIVEAVQRSRHTLLVLTRSLLESDLCNYELQMALMEGAHTNRDVVLFLLYENIPIHELSRDILFNIQAHSYIEFPHKEENKEAFWTRLAEALQR